MMRKLLVIAAAAAAVACVMAFARKRQGPAGRAMMWERMRQRMEEMPEDFPPRVMFDNVQATRANTEKILAILESEPTEEAESEGGAEG